eukprot:scaffold296279_cov21-Tisochrysis_lutea.AAC.1
MVLSDQISEQQVARTVRQAVHGPKVRSPGCGEHAYGYEAQACRITGTGMHAELTYLPLPRLCDALFQTHENLEHLAMMEQVLGPIPEAMVERSNKAASKCFVEN